MQGFVLSFDRFSQDFLFLLFHHSLNDNLFYILNIVSQTSVLFVLQEYHYHIHLCKGYIENLLRKTLQDTEHNHFFWCSKHTIRKFRNSFIVCFLSVSTLIPQYLHISHDINIYFEYTFLFLNENPVNTHHHKVVHYVEYSLSLF